MLADHALMSFEVLRSWVPKFREEDRGYVENYINSASFRICDILGVPGIIRRTCTDIHDYRKEIILREYPVISVSSVKYDATRKFDGTNEYPYVAYDDYYWEPGSRILSLFYVPGSFYYKKTIQVVYVAGKYRIDYKSSHEPTEAVTGELWYDLNTGVYKLCGGSEWEVIDSSLVVDDLIQNALVECIKFNHDRITQDIVGKRSQQSNSGVSFFSQVEIEIPKNIPDMLQGQRSLI
jgi:hypothetical protein